MPEIDWTSLLTSPLVLGVPFAVGIALLVWVITEASSFFVPAKMRPVVAMTLGPVLGWLTQAGTLLDFGAGPGSWLRAFLFGLLGGAIAVLAHDHIKERFPFSLLARVTPSAPAPSAPKEDP